MTTICCGLAENSGNHNILYFAGNCTMRPLNTGFPAVESAGAGFTGGFSGSELPKTQCRCGADGCLYSETQD